MWENVNIRNKRKLFSIENYSLTNIEIYQRNKLRKGYEKHQISVKTMDCNWVFKQRRRQLRRRTTS